MQVREPRAEGRQNREESKERRLTARLTLVSSACRAPHQVRVGGGRRETWRSRKDEEEIEVSLDRGVEREKKVYVM